MPDPLKKALVPGTLLVLITSSLFCFNSSFLGKFIQGHFDPSEEEIKSRYEEKDTYMCTKTTTASGK